MKCVCPMGGDRTCPDDCLLAAWHNLPDNQKTPERRRPIVKALAEQGYVQDAIARQLVVSQDTVSRDLTALQMIGNVKGQGKDALGRKRSPGRPKGNKPKKQRGAADKYKKAREIVRPRIEADEDLEAGELEKVYGISKDTFERAALAEQARKEALADPEIDRAELSLTAQQKLDAAVRQHQRKLDLQFEQRVRAEACRRVDEITLPYWQQQIDQAQELYSRRRALMDKDMFNTIRRALHPDSRQAISDKKLGEAFDAFMSLEKYLLDEKNSPTKFVCSDGGGLPNNLAEWDKRRMGVKTAKRSSNSLRRN